MKLTRVESIAAAIFVFIALPIPSVGIAAEYPAAKENDWIVHDFRFHTGEVLPELRLHYRTMGESTGIPVLILHGTGQSGSNFLTDTFAGELFGAGQPLDARRYYVILPDAVGHGKSSKPSDGLRTKFPNYNYDDMVSSQYRLLTEHLGIRHLRLLIGSSMGGMQAWIWGEQYPGFMDALVPLATEPAAMAGRNWMLRRMVIDAIRRDPEWHDGNYTKQPAEWRFSQTFFNIATTGGALALLTASPTRKDSDAELLKRFSQNQSETTDTNDVLYQFESVRDYDPSAGLGRITARVLAINSADDERNPQELGVMERAMKQVKNGRYILLPVTPLSRGHSTTINAGIWKRYLADLLKR